MKFILIKFSFLLVFFLSLIEARSQCEYRVREEGGCCVFFDRGTNTWPPGEYRWDYGDGTTGFSDRHCYITNGDYTVLLINLSTGSVCRTRRVTISCVPPPPPPPYICSSLIVYPNPTTIHDATFINFRFSDSRLNSENFTFEFRIWRIDGVFITSGTTSVDTRINLFDLVGAGWHAISVRCPNGEWVSSLFFISERIRIHSPNNPGKLLRN